MRERALRRALLCSIAALAAAGATSATASAASSTTVYASIQGAGKLTGLGQSCSQGAGVTNATVMACPDPWVLKTTLATLDLTPTPAPGWKFAGWTNCAQLSGSACEFTVPLQDNRDVIARPLARFVDTTAPKVTFGDVVQSPTRELTASVSWDAGEPNVGYACSIDGAPAVACTSPLQVSGAEGLHSVKVTATDANGNAGSASQDVRLVDTRLSGSQPDGAYTRDTRASFDAASVSPAFECSLDGEPFTPCDRHIELNGLQDGRHTLKVRAIEDGIADATPVKRTWTVDTTPPETVLMVEDNTPAFSYVSTEPGSTFACSVDGVAIALPNCPITRLYGLAPGQHEFTVRAIDRAGNADPAPARYRWTVAASQISTLSAKLKPAKKARHHRKHKHARKGK